MNYYTADSLHHLTYERRERRMREAHAERLAREIRATRPQRPRPRLSVALTLRSRRRTVRPRLEA
jgi:hypothetical protein